MKIFHINGPFDRDKYADAVRVGAWEFQRTGLISETSAFNEFKEKKIICPECGVSLLNRVPPYIIEWQPTSDVIADFTWLAGLEDVVVSDKAKLIFEGNKITGAKYMPVKMVQSPKLKNPKKITKNSKKRIWLPYTGPEVWGFWVDNWCHINLEASFFEITSTCAHCGMIRYKRPERKDMLVINRHEWTGTDFFKINEVSPPIFCTERVVDIINTSGLTNIIYEERGKIV